MATKEKIREKVEARTKAEENINAVIQRIRQFQNELQNLSTQQGQLSAEIIRLDGWFEGAEIDYIKERDKIANEKRSQKTLKDDKGSGEVPK